MIEHIIEYSVRNRILVILVASLLTIWAIYATLDTPVDAIPDLSENQVIVFTEWMGRSPKEIEDQITYPLSLKLQGLAGVRTIRSSSEFGFSMITIIFEDNIDFYFARQRVLEKLDEVRGGGLLPPGVSPQLAPDATAVGQIFWYAVEPSPLHPHDPGTLWAINRFYIIPQLNSIPGVAQVAPVGGAPLEYLVEVIPEKLRSYGLTLQDIDSALSRANIAAGGHVIQKNNAEYLIRGIGWIRNQADIENTVIKDINGVPLYISQVATVRPNVGPRRSVFEKDGNEVAGGVVLMRHGENPLRVIGRIHEKIREIQSGLPEGVRIVPIYDRTRLIRGAIHTLTEVMWHEMLIAALAILLVLAHVRSVFVICVTLPLSVLFSFLLMWIFRQLHIVDIQANIMSLAGITISIGVLVDQAIVMTENATHTLRSHFGDTKIRGDTTQHVIAACRHVGRPIFFSVMIMLLSFIPVFLLGGREGKYFRPLAFTKSFSMVGVAIISVTLVPALIPILLKGRLRSEEENWVVRSLINIYKPFLGWALPRRNLVMWMFAVMLILAAGLFPVQAVFGLGASETTWQIFFLATVAIVTFLTVIFTEGAMWQLLSLVTLLMLSLVAYHINPKHRIGVEFIPPLDEGVLMDMPITAPRASITQVADDLKHRNSLLRSFPEVESVAGKAGRADTPTDPAPLDMVETFVNFRPREFWPHRVIRFQDAFRQTDYIYRLLEQHGLITAPTDPQDSANYINEASQKALERFDDTMRQLASQRYREFEDELSKRLTRYVITRFLDRLTVSMSGHVHHYEDMEQVIDELSRKAVHEYGICLVRSPSIADIDKLSVQLARELHAREILSEPTEALAIPNPFRSLPSAFYMGASLTVVLMLLISVFFRWYVILVLQPILILGYLCLSIGMGWLNTYHWEYIGTKLRQELTGKVIHRADLVYAELLAYRHQAWKDRVEQINWELFDVGTEVYTWYALEELAQLAHKAGLIADPAWRQSIALLFAPHSHPLADKPDQAKFPPVLQSIRETAVNWFRSWVLLWPRQGGKNGDLIADEMQRVLQVPGWSNIFTMPIINRIDMLSTGVRTDIGIKVFGPDLDTIGRICKDLEMTIKPVRGASDVIASPIVGKGYVEINIDRVRAARYGVTVEDVQREIELAMGSRVTTYILDGRNRYAVRVRYARQEREDEEKLARILIKSQIKNAANMAIVQSQVTGNKGGMTEANSNSLGQRGSTDLESPSWHQVTPPHGTSDNVLIPLGWVADIRIVEGPVMIRSENGRLYNTVTLNVRGRDTLGFVEEAQRQVAQNVFLPEGVSIAWSGEFEHQLRAAKTLRIASPLVVALIFMILYFIYKDLADAALMMLAVPEALAGGVFLLWLFPKILYGWETPPYSFSVAVWIGFIACFGMATETGVIMLVYLREAIERRGGLENIKSLAELEEAVIEGAAHRLRPKLLTEGVAILAIFPMVFATGVGGEILAPMALPVLGGLLIADEVVDIFLPVRFYWVRRARWLKLREAKIRAQQTERVPSDQQSQPVTSVHLPTNAS